MLLNNCHSIGKIKLRSGSQKSASTLEFSPACVNIFVGPNHSGKSLLLRELQSAIQNPKDVPFRKILDNFTFKAWSQDQKTSLLNELATLQQSVKPSRNNPHNHIQLDGEYGETEIFKPYWEKFTKNFPEFQSIGDAQEEVISTFLKGFFLMLGGRERLDMLKPTKRESPIKQYVHLLSKLFYSDKKRKIVQGIVYDAFRCHLAINPFGDNFEAVISKTAPSQQSERSLDDEMIVFFKKSSRIDDMSDGVRAFSGMISAVVASDAKMILIDEPEAFLHPALCIKLARELCHLAKENDQQLFIATHSAPFLMGCIQAGIDLNIIRQTYRDGTATSQLLPQEKIVPLMRQPLLRSIGALTGIFYESVIVTESDADRAFYDEINHRCLTARDPRGITDGLFLNAQNWQTTARIIAPLRRLGVAAAAVVDIDLLLEGKSDSFQTLIEAAGVPPATRQSLGQLRGQLHAILKPKDKALKKDGINCVTGDERLDLKNFVEQMAQYGVFLVYSGELECWLPNLERQQWSGKNEWLLKTFEALGEDSSDPNYVKPAEGDVWAFIGHLSSWLQNSNRLGMPEH